MDRALKDLLVPALRASGFSGSYPHFRRKTSGQADFVSVQFSRSGGRFCIELARCRPEELDTGPRRGKSFKTLSAVHFAPRLRLGSDPAAGCADHWYVFGHTTAGGDGRRPSAEEIVERALRDFRTQAEHWFADWSVPPSTGGGRGL